MKTKLPIQDSHTEFEKFVSPVRHDQQNLGRFCHGLTQDWYFGIEN
jgi:hypothetical protein